MLVGLRDRGQMLKEQNCTILKKIGILRHHINILIKFTYRVLIA